MATTINSYSVKLGMDAADFVDTTKVSRSEARALIKDIQSAQDPFEKFAVEQDRLKRALDSGAISQGVYNRILKEKQGTLPSVTAQLGPYTMAIGAVTAGLTAAGAATVAFIGHVRSVQNEIDDTADRAERLNLSFTDLKSLQFGFDRGGGVNADAVAEAVKKLQINLSKAVDGDVGLRSAFARLGIDAGQLIGIGPREAILRLAESMQSINNPADRLKLAVEVLGKGGSDLASTLGKGRQELEESIAFAQKWTSLTDQQVGLIAKNNDAWQDISVIVSGATAKLAAEMAPAMLVIAEHILTAADQMKNVDDLIRRATDNTVAWFGDMYDVAEIVAEVGSRLAAMATLDFEGMSRPIDEAVLKLDAGERMLAEVAERRFMAQLAAWDTAWQREMNRHGRRLEETDAETKAREAGENKIADMEKRRAEERERQANREAQDALRNAEKYFEDERRRQMKLREDVAKGPGSGMEAGSAEAARFMAEQANAAIAEATVKVDQKPTDEQLVEQAKIQISIARAQEVHQAEMVAKIRELKVAFEEGGQEGV